MNGTIGERMSLALFFALYCLEAGLFFTIVPWTRVWTVNPLLHHNLAIGLWADNPFVRGFIWGSSAVYSLGCGAGPGTKSVQGVKIRSRRRASIGFHSGLGKPASRRASKQQAVIASPTAQRLHLFR